MIDWNDIEIVLLDMDGTLLDLHFDNFFWLEHLPKAHAKHNDLSLEAAQAELDHLFQSTHGTLNWYCLDFWSDQLNLDMVALKAPLAHKIALRPHALSFLQWLQHNQVQTVMVTNAHRDGLELKLDKTGIAEQFQCIISSHDYGAAKEHSEFWQHLQKNLPFNPDRALLVDDNESVLDAASRFGIRHLLTIHQPDSQKAPLALSKYPAVECYQALMEQANLPSSKT